VLVLPGNNTGGRTSWLPETARSPVVRPILLGNFRFETGGSERFFAKAEGLERFFAPRGRSGAFFGALMEQFYARCSPGERFLIKFLLWERLLVLTIGISGSFWRFLRASSDFRAQHQCAEQFSAPSMRLER
jgi:hypothetical protein